MGADIHAYIEHRRAGNGELWRSFTGRINPGRNYTVFGRLAGVRGGKALVKPRGMPDDAAWESVNDNQLFIVDGEKPDSHEVTRGDAEGWVVTGNSNYIGPDNKWITHPDWHSHSWLTTDEFAAAITNDDQDEYHAVIAAMRCLESRGRIVRVVFWFDN